MLINLHLTAAFILIISVICAQCELHEYMGNVYFFSNPVKKKWFEAYKHCNEKNMELLVIESKQENDFITNLVRTSDVYSRGGSNYWMGATDLGSKDDFYWLSTGKHVEYANWANDQPSPNEHCVHLWDSHNFLWNNIDCNFNAHYICKAKPCEVL